jgi:outer membrane protein assembly factor BamC
MRLLVVIITLFVAGCGWLNDDKGIFINRADDYIDIVEREPLVIPEDLESDRVEDPFPIPPTPEQLNAEYYPGRPPRPDAIYANDNRDEVRIQRLGDRRWLVIPEPPTTVWPKVKEFLSENAVAIDAENPAFGRIDTEWLQLGDEEYRDVIRSLLSDARKDADQRVGRDRLRIRVEQGLRERTSEVHVRHENDAMGVPRVEIIDLGLVESQIPAAEVEVLSEIGAYIAAKVSEQTVSMVAREISTAAKSSLERDEQGDPILRLALDYDRAWATVGQALTRAEVEVTSLDQIVGIYYVVLQDSLLTGEEPGWFASFSIFGGKNEHDLQLHVRETSDAAYQVSVMDAEAKPVDRELSKQVLIMLREFAT